MPDPTAGRSVDEVSDCVHESAARHDSADDSDTSETFGVENARHRRSTDSACNPRSRYGVRERRVRLFRNHQSRNDIVSATRPSSALGSTGLARQCSRDRQLQQGHVGAGVRAAAPLPRRLEGVAVRRAHASRSSTSGERLLEDLRRLLPLPERVRSRNVPVAAQGLAVRMDQARHHPRGDGDHHPELHRRR